MAAELDFRATSTEARPEPTAAAAAERGCATAAWQAGRRTNGPAASTASVATPLAGTTGLGRRGRVFNAYDRLGCDSMILFEHTGPEYLEVRRVRNLLLSIFFTAGAVLLFPLVLLGLFLQGFWYLARPRLR
jgi:hypothetical protein